MTAEAAFPDDGMTADQLAEERVLEREYQHHLASTDRVSAEAEAILSAQRPVAAAEILLAYRLEVARLTERAARDLEDVGESGEELMGVARRLREG
jgi:hypothetical protein